MMNDQHLKKLYRMFSKKMKEVYEKNYNPESFGEKRIPEFNAWQTFLRSSLSMEVVDIQEGEKPGFMRIGGEVAAMRIPNPSNKHGFSREFIIVPCEFGDRCLTLEWIPDSWSPRDK